MKASQFLYTSWSNGNSINKGYGIYSLTNDVTEEEYEAVRNLLEYIPTSKMPIEPTDKQISDLFARNMAYFQLPSGRYCLAQSTYVGLDYIGRYGNYLIHGYIFNQKLENGGLPYYNSNIFRQRLSAEELASVNPSPLSIVDVTLKNSCDLSAKINEFFDEERKVNLAKLILGVIESKRKNETLYLYDVKDNISLWYYALSCCLPKSIVENLSYASYLNDIPRSQKLDIITIYKDDTRFNYENELKNGRYIFDMEKNECKSFSNSDIAAMMIIVDRFCEGEREVQQKFIENIEDVQAKIHSDFLQAVYAFSFIKSYGQYIIDLAKIEEIYDLLKKSISKNILNEMFILLINKKDSIEINQKNYHIYAEIMKNKDSIVYEKIRCNYLNKIIDFYDRNVDLPIDVQWNKSFEMFDSCPLLSKEDLSSIINESNCLKIKNGLFAYCIYIDKDDVINDKEFLRKILNYIIKFNIQKKNNDLFSLYAIEMLPLENPDVLEASIRTLLDYKDQIGVNCTKTIKDIIINNLNKHDVAINIIKMLYLFDKPYARIITNEISEQKPKEVKAILINNKIFSDFVKDANFKPEEFAKTKNVISLLTKKYRSNDISTNDYLDTCRVIYTKNNRNRKAMMKYVKDFTAVGFESKFNDMYTAFIKSVLGGTTENNLKFYCKNKKDFEAALAEFNKIGVQSARLNSYEIMAVILENTAPKTVYREKVQINSYIADQIGTNNIFVQDIISKFFERIMQNGICNIDIEDFINKFSELCNFKHCVINAFNKYQYKNIYREFENLVKNNLDYYFEDSVYYCDKKTIKKIKASSRRICKNEEIKNIILNIINQLD